MFHQLSTVGIHEFGRKNKDEAKILLLSALDTNLLRKITRSDILLPLFVKYLQVSDNQEFWTSTRLYIGLLPNLTS